MLSLANRRRDDLEEFYRRFYMDFRSPLIVETINLMRIILCGLYRNVRPVRKQEANEGDSLEAEKDEGVKE